MKSGLGRGKVGVKILTGDRKSGSIYMVTYCISVNVGSLKYVLYVHSALMYLKPTGGWGGCVYEPVSLCLPACLPACMYVCMYVCLHAGM